MFEYIRLLLAQSSFVANKVPMVRILGFIILGMMSRLLPHPPNFTAFNAIALFSICSFGNLGFSFFTAFSTMLISDLVFGFHSSMVFVYFSFGLIVLMGYGLKAKRTLMRTIFLLIASSFLFFMITNFGVWLDGSMYPKTLLGLEACYVAGIPFLVNDLMGTLLYGGVLYAISILRAGQYWQRPDRLSPSDCHPYPAD